MMKVKTTKRAIVNSSTNIRRVGYCDLNYLLTNHEPSAYTSGIYGWNFDVYNVHGVTLCTGYRNMPGESCKEVKEYEAKAQKIMSDYRKPYDKRRKAVEKLLIKFCELNGGCEENKF